MTGVAQKAVYASSSANIEVNLNVLDALEMMGKNQAQRELSTTSAPLDTKQKPAEISVRTKASSDARIVASPKRKPRNEIATFTPKPLRKPVDAFLNVTKRTNAGRNPNTSLSNVVPVFRNKDAFVAKEVTPEPSTKRATLIPQAKQTPVDNNAAEAETAIGNLNNATNKDNPTTKADAANQERIKRLEQLLNISRPDVEGNVIKKVAKNGHDQVTEEASDIDPMPSAVIPPAPPPVPVMDASDDDMVNVGEPPVPPVPSLKSVTNLESLNKENASTVRMSPKQLLKEKRLPSTPPLHSVIFDSENTHLSSDSKKRIEKILATIKEQNNGKKIRIVGYAQSSEDNSGTARHISLQRAIAVRNFMIRSGIDSSQIANVQARGDIAAADDEQNRVDILMVDENKS
ncbi:MAG: OmpA family protein [Rickettsiales bacterium]|nr:OmpA family protein [Rickettsiales bacterium]